MLRTLEYYKSKKIGRMDIRYFPDYLVPKLYQLTFKCTGTLREHLEWYVNGFIDYPNCKYCGKTLSSKNWDSKYSKYRDFCSKSCSSYYRNTSKKFKENSISKYGVDHPLKNKTIQEKRITTKLKNLSVNYPNNYQYKEANMKERTIVKSPVIEELFEYIKTISPDCVKYFRHFSGATFDLYIPSKNFGIDVLGASWNTYVPYHNKQTEIEHITVSESDYYRAKNIIHNKIKTHLLPIKIINAEECEVAILEKQLKSFFFNQNHLLGDARSSVSYALVYKGGVVSAISFNKPRFAKKYEWEIIRYTDSLSTRVTNSFSILADSFITEHDPKSIIAYSSENLEGFNFSHYSDPNYFYINEEGNKLSRYKIQKKNLSKLLGSGFNPLDTIENNMIYNGYIKVLEQPCKIYEWNREVIR